MLKIGFSELDITPPLGSLIPGYFHRREASGILDPLYAKALAAESGDMRLAILVIDVISMERFLTDRIRACVEEQTGISGSNVMISCTHTHTGLPRIEAEAELDAWQLYMVRRSADAVAEAYRNRTEAEVDYGYGYEQDIAFNRRYWMEDGTVTTNPGRLNPRIVKPAGPIDPQVAVVRIDSVDGKPLGVLSNYACHTDTVGGTRFSGDYPAWINRTLKQALGDQAVSLFCMGASGNINHVDVRLRKGLPSGRQHKIMGTVLGAEILKTRAKLNHPRRNPAMGVASRMVAAASRTISDAEAGQAERIVSELSQVNDRDRTNQQIKQHAMALSLLRAYERGRVTREYEIQAARIGELAIAALPSEMFVEYGLELKEKSPFQVNIINELSNGSGRGYCCTPEAYAQGGYEGAFQKFNEDAGALFVNTALELLHALHSGDRYSDEEEQR